MAAIVLTSTVNMPYDKWLEWRRKGIGGSDASIVCGVNGYKSPMELFMEKTGQQATEGAGEAAYWGTVLEAVVRAEFAKRTGIAVVEVNKILCSKEHPFMLANLDGACKHPTLGSCVFEAKTASAFKAGEWEETIPPEYMLQLQHYLAVTGFLGAYIAVLIGGNTFKWSFIERDEELISKLIRWESDFWEHVKSDIPPPLDGSEASAKYLKKRFPNSVTQSKIKLPHTAAELIRQYEERNLHQTIPNPPRKVKSAAPRIFPPYPPDPSFQTREPGRMRDYRKRLGFFHLQGIWVEDLQGS